MKRLLVLVGLAAMLIGAAGCSTSGQPNPVTTANSTGQPSNGGQSSVTSSDDGTGSLPVDQPCSLLSKGDLQQLGVSSPTQDKVGTAPSCEMDNAADHIIVSVFANSGLSGLQASGPVHDTTVGSHQAKQEVDNTGSCVIAIGVTDSSSVDVTVTGDGNTDPCPTALIVAKLVEPKLP